MSKRAFLALAITLFVLVLVDEAVNQTLSALDLPTAREVYAGMGLKMDRS